MPGILRKVKFQAFCFLGIEKGRFSDKIMFTTTKIKAERSVLMFKEYNMNQLILPLDLEMKLQKMILPFLFTT